MEKMVQSLDVTFLRKVFDMHARDFGGQNKIDYLGLIGIFKMIGYQPNEAQLKFFRDSCRSKDTET